MGELSVSTPPLPVCFQVHGQLGNLCSEVTEADVELYLGKFEGKLIEQSGGAGKDGGLEMGSTSKSRGVPGSGAPATIVGDAAGDAAETM